MAVGLPSWKTLIYHLLKEPDLNPNVIDGLSDGYQMPAEFYRRDKVASFLTSWLEQLLRSGRMAGFLDMGRQSMSRARMRWWQTAGRALRSDRDANTSLGSLF